MNPSYEEINLVLRDIDLAKASLTGSFYRAYWDMVKSDVCDFFRTGRLLEAIDNTNIVLTLKRTSPCFVS